VAVLLDTHAFLWWLDGDKRLSARARRRITREPDVYVSAATAWEITTKARLGKLPGALMVAADVAGAVHSQAFLPLDVTLAHAQRAGALVWEHRDPFDRMLASQALLEGMELVSSDAVFDELAVPRIT
jgi:PIN domain nuclease of toxin-antitoxin system